MIVITYIHILYIIGQPVSTTAKQNAPKIMPRGAVCYNTIFIVEILLLSYSFSSDLKSKNVSLGAAVGCTERVGKICGKRNKANCGGISV